MCHRRGGKDGSASILKRDDRLFSGEVIELQQAARESRTGPEAKSWLIEVILVCKRATPIADGTVLERRFAARRTQLQRGR